MAVIRLRDRHVDEPVEGLPYTWGQGKQWYVRLKGVTFQLGTEGLVEVAPRHFPSQLKGFRYAYEIVIN